MSQLRLTALLILLGSGWGLSQPLTKIAVSGGAAPMGLVFWQLLIGGLFLSLIVIRRGVPHVTRARLRVWIVIALIGNVLPSIATYSAARDLPAGLMAILLSTVPLFGFVYALILSLERFRLRRAVGLLIGLSGVLLLIVPEASLPDRAMVAVIPIALIGSLFYGAESNVIAKWGVAGMAPVEVLAGATLIGALMLLPVTVATGQMAVPISWGAPETALVLSAIVHACVYTGFVWLVGQAGPVFAVQISYVVTLTGIGWAMLLLGESYSGWIWGALALMLGGMALVQPRPALPQAV
ncbi:EamA-like transporter family protein [Rhodobacteraceae bacterium THAF1]|uniref:DMT family transporter n=1 Tax=Palleronia sp. THAF1 TaxID=2587842 RepID=UPI000F3CA325|nr:DMT family transporter [Palleronia sp. THAF1]QFU07973.1 EamA-like transporter family protein [Palleronia sp. THAF1]VDC27824.1 EamA-like transporter family protein [Rhodobacteraceae bacterium THAF1]